MISIFKLQFNILSNLLWQGHENVPKSNDPHGKIISILLLITVICTLLVILQAQVLWHLRMITGWFRKTHAITDCSVMISDQRRQEHSCCWLLSSKCDFLSKRQPVYLNIRGRGDNKAPAEQARCRWRWLLLLLRILIKCLRENEKLF